MTVKSDSGIDVRCDRLSLTVSIKEKKVEAKKPILQNVTANFKSGRMTAIMGASGAGKTSLLSILAGESPKNSTVDGEILVNGMACTGRKMKKISGFVFQDDVLFDTMTVREAVTMSAKLRLPDTIPDSEKMARVDEIINLLGLEKAKDTRIGTPEKKGVSGGERKRTSIAMEMVMNPSILFLDEPTSGLDTFTAYSVVSQLKDLAHAGRTVVATIHQPSSKTFMLFDDLLLLAEGRVVYYGPVSNVLPYLERHGHVCPAYMNPADFLFMEVLNDSTASNDGDSIQVVTVPGKDKEAKNQRNLALIQAWEESPECHELANAPDTTNASSIDLFSRSQKTRSSFGTQFAFLAKRVGRNMLRNKMIVVARMVRAIFMGIMISSIYYDLPSKTGFAQTQDRISALSFIVTNEMFSSVGNTIFLFSAERGVFLREYKNGYYSIMAYVLSKTLLELPLSLVAPFVTVSIMYKLVGFRPEWWAYGGCVITAQLMCLVGGAFGLFLGGLVPNFHVAMSVMPAVTLPMMIFGGVQINLESIPWYFKFMPYLSPIKWSFSSLAQLELRDLKFNPCPPDVPSSGNEALKAFSLDNEPSIFINWLVMLVMYALSTLGGIVFLWRATRK